MVSFGDGAWANAAPCVSGIKAKRSRPLIIPFFFCRIVTPYLAGFTFSQHSRVSPNRGAIDIPDFSRQMQNHTPPDMALLWVLAGNSGVGLEVAAVNIQP